MTMPVRFQADADLHYPIVVGLRRLQPAIDFQSADEAGLRGLSDEAVLALAAQEGRVLVTHDARTLPATFAQRLAEGQRNAGVIIIPKRTSYRAAIEALLLVWEASDAQEWIDLLDFFP